jgi:acetyl esterase/lipase
MKTLTVLLTSLATFAALPFAHADGPLTISDVDYLGPDRAEKMDIYLPSDDYETPAPAVLLIHGGGWRVGDKASNRERSISNDLRENGYAVFSCKSALRYIRANAERLGIDPERIAVMGGSAGGHLSMMVGATANDDEINQHGLYLDQSNAVSCILNFYGIYDVRNFKITPFVGAPREVYEANKDAASPVVYFDDELPPMFIAHGSGDTTVPVQLSRDLVQNLQQLGTPYCYVEIQGAPHSFDLHPEQFDLKPTVISFLHQYLGVPQKMQ